MGERLKQHVWNWLVLRHRTALWVIFVKSYVKMSDFQDLDGVRRVCVSMNYGLTLTMLVNRYEHLPCTPLPQGVYACYQ